MPQDSASRRQDQFVVRLPDGMRERIAAAATRANRSMNSEIVSRLERTFLADEGSTSEDIVFRSTRDIVAMAEVLAGHQAVVINELKDEIAKLREAVDWKSSGAPKG